MAIGLNTGSNGGDFLPIVTWDARAGRMFKVEREQQTDGSWVSNKLDITNLQPTFLIDFLTLETGWASFTPTGPNFAMAPLGKPMPDKPTPEHKQAFRVRLFSPKFLGGLREFSSSSKAVIGALDALHSEYEATPEAAASKLPVVKLTGSNPITTKGPQGSSTNYAPVWTISAWSDRPADWSAPTVAVPRLGARTSAPPVPGLPENANPANHQPTPTNHVSPPAPISKPAAMAMADDEVPFAPF